MVNTLTSASNNSRVLLKLRKLGVVYQNENIYLIISFLTQNLLYFDYGIIKFGAWNFVGMRALYNIY